MTTPARPTRRKRPMTERPTNNRPNITLNLVAAYLAAAVLMQVAIGCEPAESQARPPAHDACADRLHDLAGGLLHHLVVHGVLPATLGDLADNPVTADIPRECPACSQPYLYFREGLPAPGDRYAVLIDPAPSHNGGRWMVLLNTANPPVPYVVWMLESNAKDILAGSSTP